jgi:hypothetical protein
MCLAVCSSVLTKVLRNITGEHHLVHPRAVGYIGEGVLMEQQGWEGSTPS